MIFSILKNQKLKSTELSNIKRRIKQKQKQVDNLSAERQYKLLKNRLPVVRFVVQWAPYRLQEELWLYTLSDYYKQEVSTASIKEVIG